MLLISVSDSHYCCRALGEDGGLSAGIHSAECYFPSVCGEILWVRKHGGGSSIRAPPRTDLLASHPSLAVSLLKYASSFEYAATFTFPLFPCHGFLSPSVNEADTVWNSGSQEKSPYGPRRSALTASHLECLDSAEAF